MRFSVDESLGTAPLDLLWVELTSLCNLNCVHCYADSGPRATTTDPIGYLDYISIIDEAASMGCKRVQFIGGEPTLVSFLPALIKRASEKQYSSIEVFTNATRISDHLIEFFLEYKVAVSISFYSFDNVVHDKITEKVGSHSMTSLNVVRLLKAGVPANVHVIEMSLNRGHVKKTLSYLQGLGVEEPSFDSARNMGRAGPIVTGCETNSRYANLCGNCGDRRLAVLPDGTVSPCAMARDDIVGSTKSQGLMEILKSPLLENFRAKLTAIGGVDGSKIKHLDCSPNKDPNHRDCSPNKDPNNKDCSPNKDPKHRDCSPNKDPNNKDCSPNKDPNHRDCSPNKDPNHKDCGPSKKPTLRAAHGWEMQLKHNQKSDFGAGDHFPLAGSP